MTAITVVHPTEGLQVLGQADGDLVGGGPLADLLSGHAGGQDVFDFHKGDGSDLIFGFERGTDVLQIHGSIRQTSLHDTAAGIEVYYGAFGQSGPDHFLVSGVHALDLSDFAFV